MRQLQEYAPYSYNCLGLWDLEMVDIKVKKIPNEKDKREALKMQLNFRQKIIGMRCKRSFFTLSSGDNMQGIIQALLLTSIFFYEGMGFMAIGHNQMCTSTLALEVAGS